MIRRESFGYKLAYVRDALAQLTQSELAEQINHILQNNAGINRTHIKNWENNTDLEQVTSGILSAIVSAVASRTPCDESERGQLTEQLRRALEETRRAMAANPTEPAIANRFGEILTQLREERLGLTQSEFAELLRPWINEPVGPTPLRVTFEDVMEVEHGRVPPREFVDATLEVFRARDVPMEALNTLRQRGEASLTRPDQLRPLANRSTDSLLARAGQIILCGGVGPVAAKQGRRAQFLGGDSPVRARRTFAEVAHATGISPSLMSAFFSMGKVDSFAADNREAIRDYLLREKVPAEEVQELEAILQEINIRKPSGGSARRPHRQTR